VALGWTGRPVRRYAKRSPQRTIVRRALAAHKNGSRIADPLEPWATHHSSLDFLFGARIEIPPSMGAEPSRDARRRKTLQQLRTLREQSAQRNAVEQERRGVEDRIREERRDGLAKTICAGRFAERRRYRSAAKLRAQREEVRREGESQPRPTPHNRRRTTPSR